MAKRNQFSSRSLVFQFKQFTIQQDRTAMKVCTDACTLGAYATPERLHLSTARPAILDIGTGTGLLALMAAQNFPLAQLEAVEIDPAAWEQACANVAASPFSDRIRVHQLPVQAFAPPYSFDLILSNPPFFTDHLRSPDAATNRALHTDTLTFPDLVAAVARLLETRGQWWVLLPPYEMDQLTELAGAAGLFAFETLQLRHNCRKAPFRRLSGFSRHPAPIRRGELTIYEPDPTRPGREVYTEAFQQLLRPFYLIF